MKERLGYNDEQMKTFRQKPRNEDILTKAVALMKKTIIVEVVDSYGCNSQHEIGHKPYFDGAGNLLTKHCPKRICVYALNAISPQIFTASELLYANVDPDDISQILSEYLYGFPPDFSQSLYNFNLKRQEKTRRTVQTKKMVIGGGHQIRHSSSILPNTIEE